MSASEFRRCLVDVDVVGAKRLWAHLFPHLPQLSFDREAVIAIHHARTQSKSISFKLRAYSHRWLTDQGYPSGLPDELKTKAERIYPSVQEAVGISVNSNSLILKPILGVVRGAMEDAVNDAFAEGRRDTEFVSARMTEARQKTIRKLVGRLAN